MGSLCWGQSLEFAGALVVDCFWLEEDDKQGCCAGERRLHPENVAPTAEGYYYTTYERACGWLVESVCWLEVVDVPSAGPMRVPLKNQPSAVPRSV